MKKLLSALGVALAVNVALVQAEEAPAADAEGARMQSTLGLTDEQVQEMRAIRDSGGSREEMNAVLTPEQRAKVADQRKSMQENSGKRKERMQKKLGLSDEQVAQIEEIRASGGSREEIRDVLTPEQQAKFDEARGMRKGKGAKPE